MFLSTAPRLMTALTADLAAAPYTVSAVSALWGEQAEAALHRAERLPALRALSGSLVTPTATLARLFVLGVDVTEDELAAAVPATGVGALLEAGIVARRGSAIVAAVDLRPYSFVDTHGAGSWWIASDLGELALGHALGEDHVLGVGGATATLTGLMLPRAVSRVLDLGTGCGIQAMHASRHAEGVVATDISERAIQFARFNAALNGLDGIEFRLGSLYEPVAGETFDHIVTNPPFVITPRVEGVPAYEYRDGGLIGDGIVEAVVSGAAAHLAPGGVLQMLGNWEYRGGQAGMDRVLAWAGSGETALDAWIIERELQDPSEYAETWIRDGGTRTGSPEFETLYGAWLDDFAARGVRQIGFGYILLRRPAAGSPRLIRSERLHSVIREGGGGLGAHLLDCLAGHDWAAAADDAELLSASLVVAPDITEERHYWPGAEDPTVITLSQGGGFGRRMPLDTALAALIGACDGELSVGAIAGAIAQLLGAEEDALIAQLLPELRRLLADAILVPAAGPAA